MEKDEKYYRDLAEFAVKKCCTCRGLAKVIGSSGGAVQMWRANGVPHKWRPVLEAKFGGAFRKCVKS